MENRKSKASLRSMPPWKEKYEEAAGHEKKRTAPCSLKAGGQKRVKPLAHCARLVVERKGESSLGKGGKKSEKRPKTLER